MRMKWGINTYWIWPLLHQRSKIWTKNREILSLEWYPWNCLFIRQLSLDGKAQSSVPGELTLIYVHALLRTVLFDFIKLRMSFEWTFPSIWFFWTHREFSVRNLAQPTVAHSSFRITDSYLWYRSCSIEITVNQICSSVWHWHWDYLKLWGQMKTLRLRKWRDWRQGTWTCWKVSVTSKCNPS